ncbi:MAG: L,D-transpeptidase family protein [Pseudomonadota bacterium]
MTTCLLPPVTGRPGCLLLLLLALLTPAAALPDSGLSATIHARLAALRDDHEVTVDRSTGVLPALYAQRDYTPVWSNPAAVHQLISAIERIDADGLDPADYNLAALKLLLERNNETGNANPERTANLDLLLTDSLIRLCYHLAFGKVDPEEIDSSWNTTRQREDLAGLLQHSDAIERGQIDGLLESLRPQSHIYRQLREALATYRRYRQLGGWQPVPDGPALKPGMTDTRVLALRARLVATDDLSTQDMYLPTFDDAVEAGVRHFQQRHGLAADGVVGEKTLTELNVPVAVRIAQIRANLERARWLLRGLPDTFVMVDIAGFNVRLYRDDAVVWESRAVVGQQERMSPVIRSTLTYLDLNPTWTVPPTVLDEDLLPELRRDPQRLAEKGMQVIDYQGRPVDAAGIDWNRYSGHSFPWLIRQRPGPKNALGRIKFMFPNPYSVYLHDTPSKALFARAERAFSSGCIRIEHPYELAELLLEGNPGWDHGRLMAAVDSLQTRSVTLQEPVTILLSYWTAAVADDGTVQFNRDIYRRDPAVISGLDAAPRIRERGITRPPPEMTASLQSP